MRGAILGILAGATLAFTAAQPAAAAQLVTGSTISITGNVIASPTNQDISQATSLDFTTVSGTPTPGTPGPISSYGSGSGSFAGVFCGPGACGTIQDLNNLSVGLQPFANFFVLTGGTGPASIAFSLTAITSIVRSNPGFLDFTATGTFNVTGFDPTPGIFYFSAQGNNVTSFSASTVAVPEPGTWALMLLGFGGIGMAMRRRRRPALAQIA
jgi:hypothetical protein